MRSSFKTWAGISLAVSAVYAQTSETVTVAPSTISTSTTVNETVVEICPPAPTIFFNVTEYVPITETETTTATAVTTATFVSTTTTPITIFQTIISTTVLTATETLTTTQTETETSTTTSTTVTTTVSPTTTTDTVSTTITDTVTTPTTATATEIISEYLTTEQVTSITLCPSRTVNPTYTANEPYPTDWTWGCPPGWLCKPLQENCNFEAGIPEDYFYCSPNECIPADVLPAALPNTWNTDIYGNNTPLTDPSLRYDAIDSFFNMDPQGFGLTYEIFVVNEVFTLTSTFLEQPTPTVAARQAQTSVPGACYPWCNNCLLEAQSNGKNSKLCLPGSAFETSLSQCEQCISVHKSDSAASFVQIAPQFQQFLDYCEQYATVVVTTSVTSTATNAAGTAVTVISSALSTTVTPTSLASTSTSYGPVTSVTTVATTATPVPATTTTTPTPTTTSYTTTQSGTVTTSTTSYTPTTIPASEWSQITIILPWGTNSTTTIYGSTLPTGAATLVLPAEFYASSPTNTAVASVSGSGSGSGNGTGTSTAPVSTFTGAASSTKVPSIGIYWSTILVGLVVPCLFALSL